MDFRFKLFVLALGVLTLDTVNARNAGGRKYLNSTTTSSEGNQTRKLEDGLTAEDLETLSPEELVQHILGRDVLATNIIYTGADVASGTFAGGGDIIGFDTGIVLTTGSVANIIGPNVDDGITADNRLFGDPDLDKLIPNANSLDASSLEFDFECVGTDNIWFEYVFASDEYNEYVDSVFNDVFGFFLNGVNVALIPGTNTPVTINNVNCGNPYQSPGSFCDLFNNNDLSDGGPFFNTEMDGFTNVLTVNAPMAPGLNHIKLAISDAGDMYFDSAVFIKEGSFSCIEPVIGGDPHIKTWSNKVYDFHGICDLVFLQNPGFQGGLGMDIHVRTKQILQFSFVSSAALRIGEDILEVMGDTHDNLFWINKRSYINVNNGIVGVISGYPIRYKKINSKQHEFTVNMGDMTSIFSIVMKTYKNFVKVKIRGATEESFRGSLGLLGLYGSGEMTARDGSTKIEDTNAFGQEWQVGPLDGMLFHDKEGPQAPDICKIPLGGSLRRRLSESNISKNEAEIACARVSPSDLDMCVFDVMATGDRDVVGAY